LNIYCPKHKNEKLYILKYSKVNPSKKVRQGMIVKKNIQTTGDIQMIICCPKHKNEKLRQLFVSVSSYSSNDSRSTEVSDYMFCEKCNKPYKPKVIF